MLSVCIPVYNYKVVNLLEKLSFLLKKAGIKYELLVVDDASEEFYKNQNKSVAEQFDARYILLEENIGRSAIRNYLCKIASYDNLLFLDCDSKINNERFISNYLGYFNKQIVVYGGTEYQYKKPEKKYRLHWTYGRKREIKPVEVRNLFPHQSLKTNNFLVPRSILEKHPFNEHLKGYGHEDTLMGLQFSQNNIKVYHIDNPVLHAGLETNEQFILKTEEGIKNLIIISEKIEGQELNTHFKLLKVFSKVESWNLTGVLNFTFLLIKPLLLFIIKRLYLMSALDFYKLGFLCSVYRKNYVTKQKAPLLE